ncbi:MAG: inovirus-type Gp2 protein [Desulfovibrionaceae bacterium]|nr:inovirus-type Gp2 protein [Desulfovibrionaceae bacterium]
MTDEETNKGCDTEILDRHIERTEDMTGRHNKVLGFRIDLDYRSPVASKKSIQDISNTIARTKRYFDRKGIDTSFSWRQEESKQTLPHGHVAVMVDGNKLMAPGKVVDKLKENWKRQAGEDNSRIFICEGTYRMRRNDSDFKQVKDDWIHRTSYLAKERDRGNTPDRQHEHGGTRVKKR